MLALTKCSLPARTNGCVNTAAIRCGHLDGATLVPDVLEQDPELVAAEARNGVAGPHRLLEAGRRRGEQLVADLVSETVVDQLEAIEVEEQDRRQRRAGAAGADRLLEAVDEQGRLGSPVSGSCSARWRMSSSIELALERVGEHIGQRLDEVDVARAVIARREIEWMPSTPNGPRRPSIGTVSPLRTPASADGERLKAAARSLQSLDDDGRAGQDV